MVFNRTYEENIFFSCYNKINIFLYISLAFIIIMLESFFVKIHHCDQIFFCKCKCSRLLYITYKKDKTSLSSYLKNELFIILVQNFKHIYSLEIYQSIFSLFWFVLLFCRNYCISCSFSFLYKYLEFFDRNPSMDVQVENHFVCFDRSCFCFSSCCRSILF